MISRRQGMKYFNRFIFLSAVCVTIGIAMILVNIKDWSIINSQAVRAVVNDTSADIFVKTPNGYEDKRPVLILTTSEDVTSEKITRNVEETLDYQKKSHETVELADADSINYEDYSIIVLASTRIDQEFAGGMSEVMDYVENGGLLFWAITPDGFVGELRSIYQQLGIYEYDHYYIYKNITFEKELLPGLKGKTFEDDSMFDNGVFYRLKDDVELIASAKVDGQTMPVVWMRHLNKGRVLVYNGSMLSGDYFKGLIAGCLNCLQDTVIYPVINAKCVFIGDFPAPQYEMNNEILKTEYNRSTVEFYRDIWWPDMQKAARQHNLAYTGLFMTGYNDIVDPDKFVLDQTGTEKYYGNSLLKTGNEMGIYGYNHQPLVLEGDIPAPSGYNAWKSQEDMEASLIKFKEIAQDLFPGVRFHTYVPPSNYLSEEGRQAVRNIFPEVEVISGVYSAEDGDGAVCQQKFEIAEDGIAEFPAIVSGMELSDYFRLAWISELGLHGVYSHFIHPNYLFDTEHNQGKNWETLFKAYDAVLDELDEILPELRGLKAIDAAEALRVYDASEIKTVINEDRIHGVISGFRGEAFFYLYTDKYPVAENENCKITAIGGNNGDRYYLVEAAAPEFTIILEER